MKRTEFKIWAKHIGQEKCFLGTQDFNISELEQVINNVKQSNLYEELYIFDCKNNMPYKNIKNHLA